jgi:hypothetical protein
MTLYVPALVISHAHSAYGQSVRHDRTVRGQLTDNPWTTNEWSQIVVETSRVICEILRSIRMVREYVADGPCLLFFVSLRNFKFFWLIWCINWGHCSKFSSILQLTPLNQ